MINDRYKIIRKVGEGRSRVYLSEDILRKDSKVALKILSPDTGTEEKRSFRDEYFLLKKLNHPNIISVFDFGIVVSLDEEDGKYKIDNASLFFTLEYFEGMELYEYKDIQQEAVLTDVICQVSSVLYYLHQSSYIYYDLKSENILIQQKDGIPVIKFIDFGLTTGIKEIDGTGARGTAEYIAPEILRNEKIDHRIDLYSLGIMLYRIIYGKFPFQRNDQLGIYKAHLDARFEYPVSGYSDKLVNLVKKLLSKDADERFATSLGIINEINPGVIKSYKNEWTRIPAFSGRKDSLSIISNYIEKGNGGEVLSIKGAEGAGKSTLLQELKYKYPLSLLVSPDQNIGYSIWQVLLRGILYQQNIYPKLNSNTITEAGRILNGNSVNLVEDLKTIIIKLISADRFILLIDNFNLLGNFDLEIFLQLIPVLQVSRIKIVLTEDSSYDYKSAVINNLQVINLNPFTELQVTEFVQNSFAEFFPRDELKKAVILYSDLLPGSIEIFLKDLIVLDILKFTTSGPVLKIDESIDRILKGSQEDIYRFRLNNLDSASRDLAIFLSLFDINLDIITISQLTDTPRQKVANTLIKLSEANILHYSTFLGIAQFTSQGLKEYICSTIEDIKEAHSQVAELIREIVPHFNSNELARHLELAGKYEEAYRALKEELTRARNTSALSYERNILEHLSKLPLEYDSLRDIRIALSNCLFQIGELNASIELTNELLENTRSSEEEISLKILKGKALISIQSLEEGEILLESILNKIENNERRNEILAEIAEAEYEMAKYYESENLADKLIADPSTSTETKGKIYRVKGLIELYKNNSPEKTISCFENSLLLFERKNMLAKIAAMENNLGNIFNVINEKNKAEEHWNKAIEINNSIGNLLYNAIILLNFGIYFLENSSYEKAIDYYMDAQSLFKTLGDKNNLGITLINLGEVYTILCEYEKAAEVLKTASEIFDGLDNNLEKGEASFLLGKLFFEIGDIENLGKKLESYSEFKGLHLDKLNFNYSYLNVLYKILKNEIPGVMEELLMLSERSRAYSDNLLYCEIQVKTVEHLLTIKQYPDALKELIAEDFINMCSKNPYFSSYRNFLMGKVTEVIKSQDHQPFLTYYEEAFSQVSTISITELTWKILFELYRVYNERGNISRAAEHKKYARQTIYYIIDQIKSTRLRKIYLEKPERKYVLRKLEEN